MLIYSLWCVEYLHTFCIELGLSGAYRYVTVQQLIIVLILVNFWVYKLRPHYFVKNIMNKKNKI
jgi:hypothetical protein